MSYRLDVAPLLSKAGCNQGTCHGALTGKGGFRLSLRGDDPGFDRMMITRASMGRRVDRARPAESLVILKPLGAVEHEGGKRFGAGSFAHEALRRWIARGAVDDVATAPTVTQLEVVPRDRTIAHPGRSQQLVVTAHFSDGGVRDVTEKACYEHNLPSGVEIGSGGRVEVARPAELTVLVRYATARAVSRLAFLPDRPGFVQREFPAHNFIDEQARAKWRAIQVHPSDLARDETFLRRAFLVALGVLPTVEEARAFLADADPRKREKLIDRLVERPEFADFWALKWADVLRNEEKQMGVKGVWTFRRWLTRQIERDRPLDAMVRDLVSSVGSTWENPPAAFYRTNRDPLTAAETVGQVFLGYRLKCARCHNHPFDVWRQDDYYGLAAHFSNIGRKRLSNRRRDRFDKHEINGDEIIYVTAAKAPALRQPNSGVMLAPTPLGGEASSDDDPRRTLDNLADWLTQGNRQFARNQANRIWFHLMGRGIVDPPDDFRMSNPPSNPELLEALTDRLIAYRMRLKPMVATIMKSRVFQLDARPTATNRDDERNFARYAVRLPPGEVMLDALSEVLERPQRFAGAPAGLRAVQLPGVPKGDAFLKTFGKPTRLLACECERSDSTTLAQAFQMINGPVMRAKLEAAENRIGRLLDAGTAPAPMIEEFYLAALCRFPTDAERHAALAHLKNASKPRQAAEDLVWSLLNSKEFLLLR